MRTVVLVLVVGVLALIQIPLRAADDVGGPQAFETPEALVEAWLAAAAKNDDDALRALAGTAYADLVQPGGDPTVAQVRATFVEKANEFWTLRDNDDGTKTLVLGDNRWPFPIPIHQTDAGWTLDAEAGLEEMRMRRIGWNELTAIKLCRAYVELQEEYHAKDRDDDGVLEYAQRVRSTPGMKDGLWWETGEDGDVSPLGPLVASYETYLRNHEPGDPVGGYYWKILKWQGPSAPGGQHSYVINGNMIAGFALIGAPARYGESGVKTFLVSHHGKILEKDLGACTGGALRVLEFYNPDDTWTEVEE